MILQNDRNKILNNFLFVHFLPGSLENWKMAKNVIFYPKNVPKTKKLKSAIFQATDLNDS